MILKVGHVGNRPPRRSKQFSLLSLRTHYLTHTFCFHFCAPTSRVSRRLGALCQGTCHHAPTKYTVNRAGRAWRALGKLPTQPEAAEKGRSGVLLLLLLNPRGRRNRTIPLASPAGLEKDGRSRPQQPRGPRKRGARPQPHELDITVASRHQGSGA